MKVTLASAAAVAQQAGEAAAELEVYAEELGRLQHELGGGGGVGGGAEQWRSPAGRAFEERLHALAAELGACRDALERAASARRMVAATEQLDVWG